MRLFSESMIATRVAVFLLASVFLSGCVSIEKLAGCFRQDAYHTHKVTWPGENLYVISRWYTGNGNNWKILAQINPELDPDRIQLGESIRIPENILQTKKPLPRASIQGLTETRVGASRHEEPPMLFGPKPYAAR